MQTAKSVFSAQDIVLFISTEYWVKQHNPTTISVIASYKHQLDALAEKYNMELVVFKDTSTTCWGEFHLPKLKQ